MDSYVTRTHATALRGFKIKPAKPEMKISGVSMKRFTDDYKALNDHFNDRIAPCTITKTVWERRNFMFLQLLMVNIGFLQNFSMNA